MKIILLLLIFSILLSKSVFSNDRIYETDYYNIKIDNGNIIDGKNREINEIKIASLFSILKKILTKKQFNQFNKFVDINSEINNLIQNMIIEDEFIYDNIYKSKVKINFNKKEIIKLLRSLKINYTDLKSPIFLLIVSEKTDLSIEGLSHNNSFYKFNNYADLNLDLINISIPELSQNDRFILPYEKIQKKDILALKYNSKFIFLIDYNIYNNEHLFNIQLFSQEDKVIKTIDTINFSTNMNYHKELFIFLNDWWKLNNQIDNSVQNKIECLLEDYNIKELNLINSKINSISQIKSNIINKIEFMNNVHTFTFYGDINVLISKMKNLNIDIQISYNNECLIQ